MTPDPSAKSPVFEPLETRTLLTGEYLPAALGQTGAIVSGPPWLDALGTSQDLNANPKGQTTAFPMPAGYQPNTVEDVAGRTLIPEYQWIRDNADYDWWYGCAPTAVGMLTAYWDHYLKASTGDYTLDVFPGDPTNWLYAANLTGPLAIDPGGPVIQPALIPSKPFSVPEFANGAVAGWAHAYTANWQLFYPFMGGNNDGTEYYRRFAHETWRGHEPDSIADFLLTESWLDIPIDDSGNPTNYIEHQGETAIGDIPTGVQNFFAWDDPRTAEDESWAVTASLVSVDPANTIPYSSEIDAGRPVLLLFNAYRTVTTTDSEGNETDQRVSLGWHTALGVGYYAAPPDNPGDPAQYYVDLYTTWHTGLEEWLWPTTENNNLVGQEISIDGVDFQFILENMVTVSRPTRTRFGMPVPYLSIASNDVSKLDVFIGLGDPASPQWQSTDLAVGQTGANLVLTDIQLPGAAITALDTTEDWYLKVSSSGGSATIMDFQVRYGNQRWLTGNVDTVVSSGQTGYAYLTSEVKGSLGGSVFLDANGNGARDAGETGLGGMTVFLDADYDGILDASEARTTTDAAGKYSFADLWSATRNVRVDLPAGWVVTAPTGGNWSGNPQGDTITGIDFGVYQAGRISGAVWDDANGDGVRQGGETGLSGRRIFTDLDNDGMLDWADANANGAFDEGEGEKWTDTNANGDYELAGLAPGAYTVREVLPRNWRRSSPAAGKYSVTIASGDAVTGRDFGESQANMPNLTDMGNAFSGFSPATVSPGASWSASRRIINTGGGPAGAFSVSFYASVDVNLLTTADNFLLGSVPVAGLAAGQSKTVTLSLADFPTLLADNYYVGAIIDSADAVAESQEDDNAALDYLNKLLVPGIRGIVWNDVDHDAVKDISEAGLPGWTVYIDSDNDNQKDANEKSATTDASGNYSFTGLSAGTYTIREVLQGGWQRSTPPSGGITVAYASHALVTGKNFGNYRPAVPDLQDDSDLYSKISPSQVVALVDPCNIWWDIRNSGPVAAGPFRVDFYASVDTSLDTTADNYFLGYVTVPGAAAGTSNVQLPLLRFPLLPEGYYYVGVIIDSLNQVTESNESNNTGMDLDAALRLQVIHQADLRSDGVSLSGYSPVAVSVGDKWHAWWSVSNAGSSNAGGFFVNFYAGNSATSTDWLLGRAWVAALAANTSTKVDLSLFAFPDIPAGQYYVNVQIDPENKVQEHNEDNNIASDDAFPLSVAGFRGSVWQDIDGDSTKDLGEPNLSGWVVFADQDDDGQLDRDEPYARTGSDGVYSFTNLSSGGYIFREVVRDGWQQTSPASGYHWASVSSDDLIMSQANFGNILLSKVGGYSGHDENGNGTGEGSIPEPEVEYTIRGRTITIFRDDNGNGLLDSGEWNITAVTGQIPNTDPRNDTYELAGIPPGTYLIVETLPQDWVGTNPKSGNIPITIRSAEMVGHDDLFSAHSVIIRGNIWHDFNGDGVKDTGESGLTGWTVTARNNALDLTVTAITDLQGNYVFDNLPPGDYVVEEDLVGENAKQDLLLEPHWNQTAPPPPPPQTWPVVVYDRLGTGNLKDNVNFGNYQYGTIQGYVWHDLDADAVRKAANEPGLADQRVFLDLNGNGVFNWNDANNNNVWDAGEGEQWATSAPDGSYRLTDVALGVYKVYCEVTPPWLLSANDGTLYGVPVEIASGAVISQDFGAYQRSSIMGAVWRDDDGDGTRDFVDNGLGGWTVYLDQNKDGRLNEGERTAATDLGGNYVLDALKPGNYTVALELEEGWVVSTPTDGIRTVTVVSADPPHVGSDFGAYRYGQVSGAVWDDQDFDGARDAGEPGLAGWIVFLDTNANGHRDWTDVNGNGVFDPNTDTGDPWTVTGGDGTYALASLKPGSYALGEEVPSGWTQSYPTSHTYSIRIVDGTNITGRNFGNYRSGTIGGAVWHDSNFNGLREGGEAGLGGWQVSLFLDANHSGTQDITERLIKVTTASDGTYSFEGLIPGTYVLAEIVSSGWVRTYPAESSSSVAVLGGQTETRDFGNEMMPTAGNLAVQTPEDTPLIGTVTGSDGEGGAVTFSLKSQPGHGSVVMGTDGAFAYTPGANYNGPDSFTFVANDGYVDSAIRTVSITVTPVNDAPTADVPAPVTVDEDGQVHIALSGSDVETAANKLVYQLAGDAANGTVTIAGNVATYRPDPDYNGPDSFTFTVRDTGDPAGSGGGLTSSPVTVDVTVRPVNDVPLADDQTVIVLDRDGEEIDLYGSDVETDDADLVYQIVTQPSHGTVTLAGNVAVYVPAIDWYGQDSFKYVVIDTGDPAGAGGPAATGAAGTIRVATPSFKTFDASSKVIAYPSVNQPAYFVLKGPGQGYLYQTDLDTRNVSMIVLEGTTVKSSLTIIAKSRVTVGDIVVHGALSKLVGVTTDLEGDIIIDETVQSLQLDEVTGGRTVTIKGAGVPVKLKFDQIADLRIQSASPISSLTATDWRDTVGPSDEIKAPSIGLLKITGSPSLGLGNFAAGLSLTGALAGVSIAGDLQNAYWGLQRIGNLNVRGNITNMTFALSQDVDPSGKVFALDKMTVGGWVRYSQVSSAGSINSVKAGGMEGANFLAGYDGPPQGVSGLPSVGDPAEFDALAFIKNIAVKGMKVGRATVDSFINSDIAAARIGTASLSMVRTPNNGLPFGLSGLSFKKVTYLSPTGKHVWTGLGTPPLEDNFTVLDS